MHYHMVKRGNLYLERAKPRYVLDKKDLTGAMKRGVGTVTGEVEAASYDRFYLRLPNDTLQQILNGDAEPPQVGTTIDVTYAGGQPPKALMWKSVGQK